MFSWLVKTKFDWFNSIIKGDVDGIRDHLKNNPDFDVNQYNDKGIAGLHYACYYKQYGIVQLLLNHGALVDILSTQKVKQSGIIYSIPNVICSYPGEQWNLAVFNTPNSTPLHFAANRKDNIEIIKLLIENNAKINGQNIDKNTALHMVIKSGDIEAMQFLIKNKADLNIRDHFGRKAIAVAVDCHKTEILKYLLNEFNFLSDKEIIDQFGKVLEIRDNAEKREKSVLQTISNVMVSDSVSETYKIIEKYLLYIRVAETLAKAIKSHFEKADPCSINFTEEGVVRSLTTYGHFQNKNLLKWTIGENGGDIIDKNNKIITINYLYLAGISKTIAPKESQDTLHLSQFPQEILWHIFSYLDLSDVVHNKHNYTGETDIIGDLG